MKYGHLYIVSSDIFKDKILFFVIAAIITFTMPRKSRLQLPPLNITNDSIGKRLAEIRKEKGYTQVELAEKIGLVQNLISDYENDKLRLHAEMLIRFAQALDVDVSDILPIKDRKKNIAKPSLKILRRLQKIELLPTAQQKTLLKTIDTFLKGSGI